MDELLRKKTRPVVRRQVPHFDPCVRGRQFSFLLRGLQPLRAPLRSACHGTSLLPALCQSPSNASRIRSKMPCFFVLRLVSRRSGPSAETSVSIGSSTASSVSIFF